MNRKLLDHLVRLRLVDVTTLRAVVAKQKETGGDLVDLLLKGGAINEVDLARGFGSLFKYKVVDINRVKPKAEALALVATDVCQTHLLLPFSLDRPSGDLLVAISDPFAAMAVLDSLQAKIGRAIRPYVAPRNALREAIRRHCPGVGLGYSPSLEASARVAPSSAEVSTMAAVPGFDSQVGGREATCGVDKRRPRPQVSAVDRFFEQDLSGGSRSGTFGDDRRATSNFFGEARAVSNALGDLHGAESLQDSDGNVGVFGDNLESSGLYDEDGHGVQTSLGSSVSAFQDDQVLDHLHKENLVLRQQIHRLETSLQLEINLVRQLVELLLEQGVLDRGAYLAKVGKLR
ncbi:MAG: hypothetical protein CO108_19110 [Deltaproteobacteria bacterium CG_4_9_14_3_um_filter_63_12]|nr:MAG: hypothetical protein CO108_19110 [Deltaproteobacteria bacterium CG_4_9_14_3_um_filter_63_12]